MYLNAFVSTYHSNTDLTWVWAVGLEMAPSVKFYEIAKKLVLGFRWFFTTPWRHRSQQKYEIKNGVTVLVQVNIAIPWRIKRASIKTRHIKVRELITAPMTQEICAMQNQEIMHLNTNLKAIVKNVAKIHSSRSKNKMTG